MSNILESILIDLKKGTDMHEHVIDVNLISTAIDRLELFPMSMVQLQETRIGQLLQVIRHKVEPTLQKRIRFIIKAWQKLLETDCATIIPLYIDKRNSNSIVNLSEIDVCPSSLSSANNSTSCLTRHQSTTLTSPDHSTTNSSASTASLTLYSQPPTSPKPSNPNCFQSKKPILKELPIPSSIVQSYGESPFITPPKINGQIIQRANHNSSRSGTLESIDTDLNDSVSFPSHARRVSIAPRLLKVKSTAELIQAAGSCIDADTVDRILQNRIVKESDESPHVVPYLQSRAARNTRVCNSTAPLLSSSLDDVKKTKPAGSHESDLMTTFLDTTVRHHENLKSHNISDLNLPSATLQASVKKSSHINSSEQLKLSLLESTLSSEKLKERDEPTAKKKQKRTHTHIQDLSELHVINIDNSRVEEPPITNRMNEWPLLPPLSESKSFSNDERDEMHILSPSTDPSIVDRLLFGTWPGINATADKNTESKFHPMTALYSVDLEDDQLIHVLPWTNLSEYKKSFFPPESSDELEFLLNLPDPW